MPRPRFSLVVSFFQFLAFWKKRKPLNGDSGTLILLLGSSRSGRSHFINAARSEDPTLSLNRAPSHQRLISDADPEVQHFTVDSRPGSPRSPPVILVEVPGFDNSRIDDVQVIEMLLSWLQTNCAKGVNLGGILYFYDTYNEKLNRKPLEQPPQLILSLLGDPVLARRLTVVTSQWDKLCDICTIDVEQEGKKLEDTSLCRILRSTQSRSDPGRDPHHIAHFRNDDPESSWEPIDRLLRIPPVRLKSLKRILESAINVLARTTPSTTPRPDIHSTPVSAIGPPSPSPIPVRQDTCRRMAALPAPARKKPTTRRSPAIILDPNPVPSRFKFPSSTRPSSLPSPVQFPTLGPLAGSLSDVACNVSEPPSEVSLEANHSEPHTTGDPESDAASAEASLPEAPEPESALPVSPNRSTRNSSNLGSDLADTLVPEDLELYDALTPTQELHSAISPLSSGTTELTIRVLQTPTGPSEPELKDYVSYTPPLSRKPSSHVLTVTSSASNYSQDSQPLPSSPSQTLEIRDNDVIIMVMGLEGSGKSTFINSLLPENAPKMQVGESDSLLPCTTSVNHSVLSAEALSDILGVEKDYRLVLVDTVGLHAPDKPDSQILSEIAAWSHNFVPKGGCRGGVIFLDNLSGLRRIRDADILAIEGHFGVVIATTKWSLVGEEEGQLCHEAISARRSHSSVEAAVLACKYSTDARTIVLELLSEVELEPQVDISAVFGALAKRKAKREKERESVWDTLRSSLLG